MKYLVLLLVVGIALFVLLGRTRKRGAPPASPSTSAPDGPEGAVTGKGGAQPMLACAHCGVHLPRGEAVLDAAGRSYCGDAHRLAGPR
jgi:uncharacterized protein